MTASGQGLHAEAGRILRFGLVGLAATATHAGVALGVLALSTPALIANLAGFLAAFVVSFAGHAGWTFRLASGRKRAAARFFLVSGASFLFSGVTLASLQASGRMPAWTNLLIAVAVVPACNFLAARFWAFRTAAQP